jgi:catechol 2,3-dioxygenase-like lactoylglutathione lyase family enzyme
MNPISIESFHTILYCRKWDTCVSFYRDILGFEEVDTKPGFIEVQVNPGSRIGLLRSGKKSNPGGIILTFRVGDVDEMHNRLSARNADVSAVKLHPWGARLFALRDPEGRRLEFWTPQ